MKEAALAAGLLLLAALLPPPAGALTDNLYFTIPPDSSGCLNARLPVDLHTLARDYYTLETVSDFPVNLGFVRTFAEAVNTVKVPVCFYSRGRRQGDFSYYAITANALGLHREFRGGICVSETDDRESRQPEEGQNPCDLINGYEDLFYMGFMEPVQWALPGARINYTLLVQGTSPLDLDITLESGLQVTPRSVSVRIPETGRAAVTLEAKAPDSGEYVIRARARVRLGDRYCDIPFCRMEAEARLSVGSAARSGFEVFIFPRFLSPDFAEPIPYTILIENMDEDASFIVQIMLPEGLESDWTRKTVSIRGGERRELGVNITPKSQEPGQYAIGFSVSSSGIEKTEEAYLSVREIESDISRRWGFIRNNLSEVKRRELDFEIDRFLSDYRRSGLDLDEYSKIDALLKEAEGHEPPANGHEEEPQYLSPLLIAIPAIVAILILVYMFRRKSRPFEERGEEW